MAKEIVIGPERWFWRRASEIPTDPRRRIGALYRRWWEDRTGGCRPRRFVDRRSPATKRPSLKRRSRRLVVDAGQKQQLSPPFRPYRMAAGTFPHVSKSSLSELVRPALAMPPIASCNGGSIQHLSRVPYYPAPFQRRVATRKWQRGLTDASAAETLMADRADDEAGHAAVQSSYACR